MEDVDRVTPALSALIGIMIGANTVDHHAADLVLAGPIDDEDALAHRADSLHVVAARVIAADGHNMRNRFADVIAVTARIGVGDNHPFPAPKSHAGAAKIMYIGHRYFLV